MSTLIRQLATQSASSGGGKRESGIKILDSDVCVLSAKKETSEWKMRRVVLESSNIQIMNRNNNTPKDVFNLGQPGTHLNKIGNHKEKNNVFVLSDKFGSHKVFFTFESEESQSQWHNAIQTQIEQTAELNHRLRSETTSRARAQEADKKSAKKRTFGLGTLRKMLEKDSGSETEDTIMQNVQEIRKWAPTILGDEVKAKFLKYAIFFFKSADSKQIEKKVFCFSEHLVWGPRKTFVPEFALPLRESKLMFRADDQNIKNCFELVHKDVRYTLSCTQPVQRDLWFMELKNQMKHFFMQTMMREDRKEQRSQHGFKPKLREILADHELALFFRAFLHTIYNYENLTFWLQVEDYKNKPDEEIAQSAKEIYQRYFNENSEYYINVSYKLKSKLDNDISQANRSIFDDLQKDVWKMIEEDSVPKFWNSEIFREYQDNMDLERVRNPRIERTDTTVYLSAFVKKLEKQSSLNIVGNRNSFNENAAGASTPQRKDSTETNSASVTARKDSTDAPNHAQTHTPETASILDSTKLGKETS